MSKVDRARGLKFNSFFNFWKFLRSLKCLHMLKSLSKANQKSSVEFMKTYSLFSFPTLGEDVDVFAQKYKYISYRYSGRMWSHPGQAMEQRYLRVSVSHRAAFTRGPAGLRLRIPVPISSLFVPRCQPSLVPSTGSLAPLRAAWGLPRALWQAGGSLLTQHAVGFLGSQDVLDASSLAPPHVHGQVYGCKHTKENSLLRSPCSVSHVTTLSIY